MSEDETLQVDDLSITCVPTLDARRWILRRNNLGKDSGRGQRTSWYSFLHRLTRFFPFSWLKADGGITYVWNGYKAGKRMVCDQRTTHILSSYRPFADHCIAYLLKRKFPDLDWVADYRDLPLSLPGWKGDTYPWSKLERGLLSKADLITTVSEGLRKAFEPLGNRVLVVRNGVDDRYVVESPCSTDRFLIQYTGSLYSDKQDPSLLFDVLREQIDSGVLPSDKLWIRYVGPHGDQWLEWIKKYALPGEVRSIVSRQDSLQMQKEAHLNILLSWAGSGQYGIMTAKLGEYLAARRPILCMIKGEFDEEMQSIIHEYNQGLTVRVHPDKAGLLADYLVTLYRFFQEDPAHSIFTNDRNLDAMYWQSQIIALGNVFREDLK